MVMQRRTNQFDDPTSGYLALHLLSNNSYTDQQGPSLAPRVTPRQGGSDAAQRLQRWRRVFQLISSSLGLEVSLSEREALLAGDSLIAAAFLDRLKKLVLPLNLPPIPSAGPTVSHKHPRSMKSTSTKVSEMPPSHNFLPQVSVRREQSPRTVHAHQHATTQTASRSISVVAVPSTTPSSNRITSQFSTSLCNAGLSPASKRDVFHQSSKSRHLSTAHSTAEWTREKDAALMHTPLKLKPPLFKHSNTTPIGYKHFAGKTAETCGNTSGSVLSFQTFDANDVDQRLALRRKEDALRSKYNLGDDAEPCTQRCSLNRSANVILMFLWGRRTALYVQRVIETRHVAARFLQHFLQFRMAWMRRCKKGVDTFATDDSDPTHCHRCFPILLMLRRRVTAMPFLSRREEQSFLALACSQECRTAMLQLVQ